MQLHALRFLIYTRSLRLDVWDFLRDAFVQNKGVVSFKKIGLGETYCFIYVKTILVPFLWIAVVLLTSEWRTQKQVSCWKVTFVVPVKISPYSTSKKLLKNSQFPHAQKTLFRCLLKKTNAKTTFTEHVLLPSAPSAAQAGLGPPHMAVFDARGDSEGLSL